MNDWHGPRFADTEAAHNVSRYKLSSTDINRHSLQQSCTNIWGFREIYDNKIGDRVSDSKLAKQSDCGSSARGLRLSSF